MKHVPQKLLKDISLKYFKYFVDNSKKMSNFHSKYILSFSYRNKHEFRAAFLSGTQRIARPGGNLNSILDTLVHGISENYSSSPLGWDVIRLSSRRTTCRYDDVACFGGTARPNHAFHRTLHLRQRDISRREYQFRRRHATARERAAG